MDTASNKVDTYKLDNGIRVVFEQNNHLNSVTIGVWIGVGSRDENKENNGIAHVIEHMLFKGTKKMTAEELAIKTAILGGGLNAYTSKENTEYYCRTLPSCLKEAVDILGDMICNSLLDEEDLEKEKCVVCEEIDMYKDSPEDSVHEVLQKKIWRGQSIGYLISGKKKNVRTFTVLQLRAFMDKYYVGENMVVSVAGKFNKAEALSWIKEAFSDIKPSARKNDDRIKPVHNIAYFEKEKDIEQLHLNMAFPAPSFMDDSRYTAVVLNNIFGGDVNSRLFQGIREKYGLTYSVYSYGSSFSDTGLFHVYAAMSRQQKDKVFELVRDIINDLRKNGVTKSELENAKKQTVVEMSLNRDSTSSLMSANAKSVIYGIPFIPFSEKIKCIESVSEEEVNKMITECLNLQKLSYGIIGPINS